MPTLIAPPVNNRRHVEREQDRQRPKEQPERTGFLTCFLGGTGRWAAQAFAALRADHPFIPERSIYLDTDPQAPGTTDETLYLANSPEILEALHADPERFGPLVPTILKKQHRLLHPEDIGNGARTNRSLTQLVLAYYRLQVLTYLERCLIDLCKTSHCDQVIPIFVSSSGGGTGSALHILLAQALLDPSFKAQLTRTLPPHFLFSPIGFVAEPFAYALRHQPLHANKVLANAMAFRIEAAELQQRRGFSYVYHIAMTNGRGTVLDDPLELAQVLGTSVFLFEQNYPQIKSSKVDTVDSNFTNYPGRDVPEDESAD